MTQSIPYWFVVIAMGVLGFFLIRFWYTVDEVRKDVKSLMAGQYENKHAIDYIREKIKEIKEVQRDHRDEINDLDKDVDKLKKS